MRALVVTCIVFSIVPCFQAAAGGLAGVVEVGDTRDQVLQALGDPQGTVEFGQTEVLYYPRGQVDIEGGEVVNHTLLSQETFEAREQRRKAAAEAAAQKQAAEKARSVGGKPDAEVSPASEPERTDAEKKRATEKREAELEAELEQRIADGIDEPPYRMSSRKLRRYRRGRSATQLDMRRDQIVEKFEAELEEE